ncbi:MAG: FAD-binding oxidoreductase [Frankiaceae bacterium]
MATADALAGSLPAGRVVTDPDVVAGYRRDEAHLVAPGRPLAVVLARDTADVAATMRWASAHRVPVVPRGAGTGLSGGASAVDGCVVLSLARMIAIREVAPDDELIVVEPGVITADVDRAAASHGLMYAPDPSSHEISTIGGNLATNAGGLRCLKHGVTRDSVLGLEAVLADGRTIRTGGRTVKHVAGYDLTGLLVGSEGTLAVITEATLRLRPRPPVPPATVVATFPTLRAAGDAVAAVVRSGLAPSLLELLDRTTLRAIDDWKRMGLDRDAAAMLIAQTDGSSGHGAPEAAGEAVRLVLEEAGAGLAVVSGDPGEAEALLAVRRLAYPAIERLGTALVEDVGVPRSRLPEMIGAIERIAAERGVMIATVGHAGDGNLHPVFVMPGPRGVEVPAEVWAAADEVFRAALALGGTITGEHGVGALKLPWLASELGETTLGVHRAIKAALDPLGVLNPGKGV